MTSVVEQKVARILQEIRPRDGFATELLAILMEDPYRFDTIETATERSRRPWIVAVVGVVSTGVIYLASRRHHRGAA